jgi:hypothetical protein
VHGAELSAQLFKKTSQGKALDERRHSAVGSGWWQLVAVDAICAVEKLRFLGTK